MFKNPVLRWVTFILGGLATLAIIGAGAVFFLLTQFDAKAEVERAVEQASGRDLEIAGPVGVTFYPVLGLSARQASLANVEGGRAPALASIERVAIGVEIMPLIRRRAIVVRELVLEAPRIALEVDAEGQPNWILQPEAPPGAPPPGQPIETPDQLALRDVHVRNGEVSYYDARRNSGWTVTALTLNTAMRNLDQPVSFDGELTYAEQAVSFEARVDAPRAVIAGRQTGVEASVASELVTASLSGQLAAGTGAFAGQVEATGPSLRRMLAWLVAPIAQGYGLEAFTVSGTLTTAPNEIAFENASMSIDAIRGRGDFVLQQSRNKPYVSGRLELFEVDVNPYLASATRPAAQTAEIAAAAAAPTRTLDVRTAPSDAPFDFTGLQAINADLELTTGPFKLQQMRAQRTQLALVINDGFLAATIHRLEMYGGTGRGRLEFDARTPDVRLVQELVADGVDAQAFMTDAFGFSNLSGRTELNINVRTQGRTQSALIRGLDGRVSFELVSGELRGVDLGGVATTIRRALNNDLIQPNARTPLTGMSATFYIADGVMGSDSLSFNTPDLRLRGLGVIDLSTRALDLRLVPQNAVLAIPFRIHGPWDRIGYAGDLNGEARRALEPRVRAIRTASVQ